MSTTPGPTQDLGGFIICFFLFSICPFILCATSSLQSQILLILFAPSLCYLQVSSCLRSQVMCPYTKHACPDPPATDAKSHWKWEHSTEVVLAGEKGAWQRDPQDPWVGPGRADAYRPTRPGLNSTKPAESQQILIQVCVSTSCTLLPQ